MYTYTFLFLVDVLFSKTTIHTKPGLGIGGYLQDIIYLTTDNSRVPKHATKIQDISKNIIYASKTPYASQTYNIKAIVQPSALT